MYGVRCVGVWRAACGRVGAGVRMWPRGARGVGVRGVWVCWRGCGCGFLLFFFRFLFLVFRFLVFRTKN